MAFGLGCPSLGPQLGPEAKIFVFKLNVASLESQLEASKTKKLNWKNTVVRGQVNK